jgi:hypothetical protein
MFSSDILLRRLQGGPRPRKGILPPDKQRAEVSIVGRDERADIRLPILVSAAQGTPAPRHRIGHCLIK